MTINSGNLVAHITEARTRSRGRKVPPLPTFLFEETGVEVAIRRLGPFTMDEIRKSLKRQRQPPPVPTVSVEVGEMRVKMQEPNPNDPEYRRTLAEYNEWLSTSAGEKMLELMVNYCIVCEIDDDIVEDKREMLKMIDPEIEESISDRDVYIRHYLMSSAEELEKVQNFILGKSMPTKEAVEEHIESFPSEVQGEGPVPTPGSPIRLPVQ